MDRWPLARQAAVADRIAENEIAVLRRQIATQLHLDKRIRTAEVIEKWIIGQRSSRRKMLSEHHQPTAIIQRQLDRFKQPHHTEPSRAVANRRLVASHALKEMRELERKRLSLVHFRRPHVTRAVADEQVVDALSTRDVDALVVHLNLFVRFKIVPYEHLVATTDQG